MMCLDQELLTEPNWPIFAFVLWAIAFGISLILIAIFESP